MTTKVGVLESYVLELKKAAAGAVKAANTVGNSADSFKKLGETLAKRIATLENKK
jgi:hypothetical protein